ncbi:heterogeneous nuclear ribonucleoprotein L isoform X13 [Cimex lectularius]|uniref:RRM domain-containing protein n=1 Tax=Cimex lectularius TaxID=79782 RepID=A0A8I6RZR9_CIMLE|nr:heterogeneous nuclear ribonucleoprotein L isoform X13 [Cimex lectularius]
MFPLCAQELGGGYLVDDTMPPDFSLLDHTDNYNKNYEPRRKRPESEPNNVLLFTIINPVYPITVDVLHTICKPNGQVLRIVIFKKNGVQAMVEFDSIDTAKRVKEALNGADIYAGCCTLKIEFAKPTKLNVYKNDMDSWDYTNPSGMDKPPETAHTRQAPLLQEPRFGVAPQLYNFGPGKSNYQGGQTQSNYMDFEDNAYTNGRPSAYGDYVSERYPPAPVDNRFMVKGVPGREGLVAPPPPPPPPRGGTFQDLAPTNGVPGGAGCVLMAYGLDPNKANPDKLFNLFCLYGNVIRVKFLKTKEGCAMVQMGDNISVERCINHLKNMPLFGGTLQLGYSKQTFLSQVAQPYNLPDNSVSFKDFAASKNNRFMNPSMASKNRIQGPAKILHFFNTPPDITEEQLLAVIEEKEVNKPSQIKLFPKKDRSSSGLMEFDNLEDAVNCLVNCNHVPIKNPESKFPYMMKLCFSSSRTIRSPPNGSGMKDEAQQ